MVHHARVAHLAARTSLVCGLVVAILPGCFVALEYLQPAMRRPSGTVVLTDLMVIGLSLLALVLAIFLVTRPSVSRSTWLLSGLLVFLNLLNILTSLSSRPPPTN